MLRKHIPIFREDVYDEDKVFENDVKFELKMTTSLVQKKRNKAYLYHIK